MHSCGREDRPQSSCREALAAHRLGRGVRWNDNRSGMNVDKVYKNAFACLAVARAVSHSIALPLAPLPSPCNGVRKGGLWSGRCAGARRTRTRRRHAGSAAARERLLALRPVAIADCLGCGDVCGLRADLRAARNARAVSES